MHAINVFLNICKEAITKVDKNLVETLATQNKEPEEIEKLASPREMLDEILEKEESDASSHEDKNINDIKLTAEEEKSLPIEKDFKRRSKTENIITF